LAEELGVVGKDPRGALAFKFAAREVTTRLLDIGVAVGRTGVLTPYAILEPVEVGGVKVRQATLHNFETIETKDIRIGDRVLIKRAGDVIPYVIGPILGARTGSEIVFKPPANCPACAQPVEHIPDEVAWYCVNGSCPAQLIRNVEHFASREAMSVEGMGIKIVEQLVESKTIADVADLYALKNTDLLKLEGFAEKKAEKLINAIHESKKQPLSRLLFGLGIRGVGEVAASDLAKAFHSLDVMKSISFGDLQKVEGVGPNIAQAIRDWLGRPANQQLLKKLREKGVWPVQELGENLVAMELGGKVFVITGTLPSLSRSEAEDFIKLRGGKVNDSVSKKTDFLLLGAEPGSKYAKAKKLGIAILDENGLRNLVNGE
jgi:DNA ligase (NAD+)